MWGKSWFLKGAVALACLCLSGAALGQGYRPGMHFKYLETDRAGYFLLDPVAITSQPIKRLRWASDGLRLLIETAPPVSAQKVLPTAPRWSLLEDDKPETASLQIWDSVSGRLSTPWKPSPDLPNLETGEFLSNVDVVTATVEFGTELEPQKMPVMFNLKTGQVRRIFPEGQRYVFADALVSDKLPLSVWVVSKAEEPGFRTEAYLVDANGAILRTVSTQLGSREILLEFVGEEIYGVRFGETVDGKRPPPQYFAIDARSGRERALIERPRFRDEREPPAARPELELTDMDSAPGPTGPLVLTSPNLRGGEPLIVSMDASYGELSSDLKTVVYISDGVLLARPIIRVEGEALRAMFDEMERLDAIQRAKHVLMAMLSYSADNEDRVPEPAGWKTSLLPYLKNEAVMAGFEFTYQGPREWNKIEEPSKTEVGYIRVRLGRAVAYADGSVRFIPDEKKPG